MVSQHTEIKELVKDTVSLPLKILTPSPEILWAIKALEKTMASVNKPKKLKWFFFLKKKCILAVTVTMFNISSVLPCQQLGDGSPDLNTAGCRGWVLWRERGIKTNLLCHQNIKPFLELWLKWMLMSFLHFLGKLLSKVFIFFSLNRSYTIHDIMQVQDT